LGDTYTTDSIGEVRDYLKDNTSMTTLHVERLAILMRDDVISRFVTNMREDTDI
jgi:hypothetical protein